jgi:predicted peroxiredoxin
LKRLIVQLWRASAEQPDLATIPLLMASTAAAMNIDVEIHVIGSSVDLFTKANPKTQQILAPSNRPLSAFVEDAIRTGVKIKVCSTALRERQLELTDLVDGVSEVIGMVTMIDLATDSNTTVLTY